jgi:hypothetical protein
MQSMLAVLDAIGRILHAVAWPSVLIVLLTVFRKPLQGFFARLTSISGPGFEAHAEELRNKVHDATLEHRSSANDLASLEIRQSHSDEQSLSDDHNLDAFAPPSSASYSLAKRSNRFKDNEANHVRLAVNELGSAIPLTWEDRYMRAEQFMRWSDMCTEGAEDLRAQAADFVIEGRHLSGMKLLSDGIAKWVFAAATNIQGSVQTQRTLRDAANYLASVHVLNEKQAIALIDFADTSDRLLVDNERAPQSSLAAVVESSGRLLKMLVKAMATLAVYEKPVTLYRDELLRHVAGYAIRARYADVTLGRELPKYYLVQGLHPGYEAPGDIWELSFAVADPHVSHFYIETEDVTVPEPCEAIIEARFQKLGSLDPGRNYR